MDCPPGAAVTGAEVPPGVYTAVGVTTRVGSRVANGVAPGGVVAGGTGVVGAGTAVVGAGTAVVGAGTAVVGGGTAVVGGGAGVVGDGTSVVGAGTAVVGRGVTGVIEAIRVGVGVRGVGLSPVCGVRVGVEVSAGAAVEVGRSVGEGWPGIRLAVGSEAWEVGVVVPIKAGGTAGPTRVAVGEGVGDRGTARAGPRLPSSGRITSARSLRMPGRMAGINPKNVSVL